MKINAIQPWYTQHCCTNNSLSHVCILSQKATVKNVGLSVILILVWIDGERNTVTHGLKLTRLWTASSLCPLQHESGWGEWDLKRESGGLQETAGLGHQLSISNWSGNSAESRYKHHLLTFTHRRAHFKLFLFKNGYTKLSAYYV